MSDQPNTRTVYKHAVRRCTNEGDAAKALDEAYAAGFTLMGQTGGGADGNTIWLTFQRATQELVAPAPPAAQPVGFGAAPVAQPAAPPAQPQPGGNFGATSP